jgi:hypothetical protein
MVDSRKEQKQEIDNSLNVVMPHSILNVGLFSPEN